MASPGHVSIIITALETDHLIEVPASITILVHPPWEMIIVLGEAPQCSLGSTLCINGARLGPAQKGDMVAAVAYGGL